MRRRSPGKSGPMNGGDTKLFPKLPLALLAKFVIRHSPLAQTSPSTRARMTRMRSRASADATVSCASCAGAGGRLVASPLDDIEQSVARDCKPRVAEATVGVAGVDSSSSRSVHALLEGGRGARQEVDSVNGRNIGSMGSAGGGFTNSANENKCGDRAAGCTNFGSLSLRPRNTGTGPPSSTGGASAETSEEITRAGRLSLKPGDRHTSISKSKPAGAGTGPHSSTVGATGQSSGRKTWSGCRGA